MVESKLVLIDKPAGITSFDVIRRLRRHTNIKKWGHAGTLDPSATGLMLLAYEEGTKQLANLIKLDKEYVAEILIGVKTITGDMDGEVLEEVTVAEISQGEISATVQSIVGLNTLPVSAYSAIKKDGVPMYKRAFKAEKSGEVITDVPMREMKVYEAELLEFRSGDSKAIAIVRFKVASGTYIRSLAEEIGNKLGYPATLKSLRRTKVGEFDIKDALQIEEVSL